MKRFVKDGEIRQYTKIWALCLPVILAASLFWACIGLLGNVEATQAQEPHRQTSWSHAPAEIDASKFPTISVRFRCNDPLPADSDYIVIHNGEPYQPVRVATATVPISTQVAIFLDLFRWGSGDSQEMPPPSAGKIVMSIHDVIRGLEAQGVFTTTAHEMGIFLPDADLGGARSLVDSSWSISLNELADRLRRMNENWEENVPAQITVTTALWDALANIMDHDFDETIPAKYLFVYSDGTDEVSDISFQDLVAKARERNISIYVVYIPTNGQDPSLSELARQTNGQLLDPYTDTRVIVSGLTKILAPSVDCELLYRSHKALPARIRVERRNDRQVVATGMITSPVIQPPALTILSPGAGEVITHSDVITMHIAATWTFRDGLDRDIIGISSQIEWPGSTEESGQVQRIPMGTEGITVTHGNALAGPGLVRVFITDEFGIPADAVQAFVIQSPTPTPMLTPGMSDQILATINSQKIWLRLDLGRRLLLLTLEMFLLALVAVLVMWRFRKRQRITQVFQRWSSGEEKKESFAMLVRERRPEHGPNTIQSLLLFNDGTVEIPDALLEEHYNDLPDRQTEANRFKELYKATIECANEEATIRRNKMVHDPDATGMEGEINKPGVLLTAQTNGSARQLLPREPIQIRIAGATTTFPFISQYQEISYGPLKSGDIIQLGDLHYRYIALARSSAQQISNDTENTGSNGSRTDIADPDS